MVKKKAESEVKMVDAPPPTSRGRRRQTKYMREIEQARANPGKWIVIESTNTSVATNIRAGRYQGIAKGEFEVTTRAVDSVDGKQRVDVYIRLKK